MKMMYLLLSLVLMTLSCKSQSRKVDRHVGGVCEGCEAIYESKVPFDQLNAVDTLADFNEPGKKLHLFGTVYKADGKTPAPGVILYVYHTDQTGVYPTRGNEKGWDRRHGYLRGWIKTDVNGRYDFYTLRPAPYPGRTDPAHIHITIKEPDLNEYYIDSYHFNDDTLLTAKMRQETAPKGGSGILSPVLKDGVWQARRDIILGKNIEDYPH